MGEAEGCGWTGGAEADVCVCVSSRHSPIALHAADHSLSRQRRTTESADSSRRSLAEGRRELEAQRPLNESTCSRRGRARCSCSATGPQPARVQTHQSPFFQHVQSPVHAPTTAASRQAGVAGAHAVRQAAFTPAQPNSQAQPWQRAQPAGSAGPGAALAPTAGGGPTRSRTGSLNPPGLVCSGPPAAGNATSSALRLHGACVHAETPSGSGRVRANPEYRLAAVPARPGP